MDVATTPVQLPQLNYQSHFNDIFMPRLVSYARSHSGR